MAFTDFDNVTAITRSKILPGLADAIVKDNPALFRLLKKADRQDGGTYVEKVVRYANSTQGGSYSGLDTLDTAQEASLTRAQWEWRQYHQPIVFSNIDIAKNGGDAKVLDMLKVEADNAKLSLEDKFGTALYAAQSGDTLDSLVSAVDDGTNVSTYGGINRSVYTWWAGSYTASAGAMSLTDMATKWDAISDGSANPTLILCHYSEWSAYEALLQPQVRFNFSTAGYPKVDGGFQAMYFRNAPLLVDAYCTDGRMYFLNEKTLGFVTLKHPDFPTNAMGFSTTTFRAPTDQDGKVGRYIADFKSALINLGNSVHTILTRIKELANMVLYDYPQQALRRAVATTERAEVECFAFV